MQIVVRWIRACLDSNVPAIREAINDYAEWRNSNGGQMVAIGNCTIFELRLFGARVYKGNGVALDCVAPESLHAFLVHTTVV